MKQLFFLAMVLGGCLMWTTPAWAIDRDDDVRADDDEHIAYEASSSQESAKIEAKFPDEALAIRQAIERHVDHANTRNIDGYMADFLAERLRNPEIERKYATKAMALKDLNLSVHAIEFAALSRTAATVHTRQIASYSLDDGQKHIDDAIISYRWIKDSNDGQWKIASTERRRLTAE